MTRPRTLAEALAEIDALGATLDQAADVFAHLLVYLSRGGRLGYIHRAAAPLAGRLAEALHDPRLWRRVAAAQERLGPGMGPPPEWNLSERTMTVYGAVCSVTAAGRTTRVRPHEIVDRVGLSRNTVASCLQWLLRKGMIRHYADGYRSVTAERSDDGRARQGHAGSSPR